jgi:hypothetical protein
MGVVDFLIAVYRFYSYSLLSAPIMTVRSQRNIRASRLRSLIDSHRFSSKEIFLRFTIPAGISTDVAD